MKDARYICNDTIDSKAADSLEKKKNHYFYFQMKVLWQKNILQAEINF